MFSSAADTSTRLAFGPSPKLATAGPALEQEVLNLFDIMQTRLLRYAVSFGISAQDGEDIVQETFLALFHHLLQGRSNGNLHGWLFRVTHNLALKRRVRVVRESPGMEAQKTERLDLAPDPEERMLFGERHARLQSVVQALPIEDQLCLRLRAEDFRYREIAKIVGISLGSVSASLSRSLARLEQADRR
jgi:RNA polymerase sigma-70 factor, ECF subfamily